MPRPHQASAHHRHHRRLRRRLRFPGAAGPARPRPIRLKRSRACSGSIRPTCFRNDERERLARSRQLKADHLTGDIDLNEHATVRAHHAFRNGHHNAKQAQQVMAQHGCQDDDPRVLSPLRREVDESARLIVTNTAPPARARRRRCPDRWHPSRDRRPRAFSVRCGRGPPPL